MTARINASPTLLEIASSSPTRTRSENVRIDGAADAQSPRFAEALTQRTGGQRSPTPVPDSDRPTPTESDPAETPTDFTDPAVTDAEEASEPTVENTRLPVDEKRVAEQQALLGAAVLTPPALSPILPAGTGMPETEIPVAPQPATTKKVVGDGESTKARETAVARGAQSTDVQRPTIQTDRGLPSVDGTATPVDPETAVAKDTDDVPKADVPVRPETTITRTESVQVTQDAAARTPAPEARVQQRQETSNVERTPGGERSDVAALRSTESTGTETGQTASDDSTERQPARQAKGEAVSDTIRAQTAEARETATRASDGVRPIEPAPAPSAQPASTLHAAATTPVSPTAGRAVATSTLGVETNTAPPIEAQVSRGVGAVLAQKGGSVTLKLAPSSLGTLKVRMTMDSGRVTLDLEATTQKAHAALTRELPALRTSLESRGLQVERAQVHLAPTPSPVQTNTDNAQQRTDSNARDEQPDQQREQRGQEQSRREERGDGRGFERFAHDAMTDGFTLGLNERA